MVMVCTYWLLIVWLSMVINCYDIYVLLCVVILGYVSLCVVINGYIWLY